MEPKQKGRQTIDGPHGQSRFFLAEDDTCLYFEPGSEASALFWSIKGPVVPAIRSLFEREIAENIPVYGVVEYGPENPATLLERKHGWRQVWDKFIELAATDPYQLRLVRFDTKPRSIILQPLPSNRDVLGIGYAIVLQNGQAPAGEAEALRQAFELTAPYSLKSEFKWATEAFNT